MTLATATQSKSPDFQTPTAFDRGLAYVSLLFTAVVLVALVQGWSRWGEIDATIWVHIVTVLLALLIAPLQLLRRRGDPLHRALGWVWAAMLFGTALVSFWITQIFPGSFSPIHALSLLTMVCVPIMIWAARTGRIETHRGFARGLIAGAILIAGVFTLLPNRILGGWLFGVA